MRRRGVQGESEHLADARVHHHRGRRGGQDGGAVGRHGRDCGVLRPTRGHLRLRYVRRELGFLRCQEHHLQGLDGQMHLLVL
jgi:hypothetical protein